jgi:large subunit ribosomal protein L28e
MVHVPDSLVWELTKKNTSFMKKRNGSTKRTGSIKFSVEKGNIQSLSMFKYSGLANSKVADVACTPENGAVMVTKTASKAHSKPSKGIVSTPVNKNFRRVESTINKAIVDNYYRPDLKSAVLAKWTKVYQANRRAKGITKPVPVKKGGRTSSKN